jgi:AraC family transcriptional regulator of adaptative response/methylated-DNA-[protein]-cysteine methyltransferase
VRSCALGQLLVAVTARGVCALTLGDDADALREDLRVRFPLAEIVEASGDEDGREDLEPLAAAAVRMIESPELADALPLDLVGTAFQQRVWRALREVPAGETVTYAELARRIGAPAAIRAVGSACARNPVAVAVPCHRVLRSNGDLGGYRWGLSRKRALLEREKRR